MEFRRSNYWRATSTSTDDYGNKCFEAGADAMLQALRKAGIPSEMMELQPDGEQKRIKGIKVFVPDDE